MIQTSWMNQRGGSRGVLRAEWGMSIAVPSVSVGDQGRGGNQQEYGVGKRATSPGRAVIANEPERVTGAMDDNTARPSGPRLAVAMRDQRRNQGRKSLTAAGVRERLRVEARYVRLGGEGRFGVGLRWL
jgi:hypothetical protein